MDSISQFIVPQITKENEVYIKCIHLSKTKVRAQFKFWEITFIMCESATHKNQKYADQCYDAQYGKVLCFENKTRNRCLL